MKSNQEKLKQILLFNAVFSTTSGTVLILFSNPIAAIFSLKTGLPLQLIGTALLAFVFQLIWTRSKFPIPPFAVKGIIFQDLIWVLGSLILIIWNPFLISTLGLWIISIIAIIVFMFAWLQWKYLKNA